MNFTFTITNIIIRSFPGSSHCKESACNAGAAAAAKSLQSCPTLCNPRDSSTPGSTFPGILQARTCHFLLQCMEVKSESEVTQSCPTLSDPMDCSLPGFSIHGIFQARVLEWAAIAFSNKTANVVLNKAPEVLVLTSRIKPSYYVILFFMFRTV